LDDATTGALRDNLFRCHGFTSRRGGVGTMTARERTMWEQAVQVLKQNTVTNTITVELPEAKLVLAKARVCAALRRRRARENPEYRLSLTQS